MSTATIVAKNEQYVPGISLFAQLLANENISVRVDHQTDTAYFDPKNRVLTLPSWKGFTYRAWLLFIAHEDGHAIYTPPDALTSTRFRALQQKYGADATMIVANIFEDIRIERLIRRKYRGLAEIFSQGYYDLMQDAFFGFKTITQSEFEQKNTLDRLNIYAKAGSLLHVTLTNPRDIAWYNRGLRAETFDDVMDIVTLVLAELTEEMKNQPQRPSPQSQGDGTGAGPTNTMQQGSSGTGDMSGDSSEQTNNDGQQSQQQGSGTDASNQPSNQQSSQQGSGKGQQDAGNQQGDESKNEASGNQPQQTSGDTNPGTSMQGGDGAPSKNPFTCQSLETAQRMLQNNRDPYVSTVFLEKREPLTIIGTSQLLNSWMSNTEIPVDEPEGM